MAEILILESDTFLCKNIKKYNLVSRILTCIQKVCKKPEIHAKIWPYIKNSNLHSKGMQKTEIHAKIWPYREDSNLHSKGMKKKNRFSRKKTHI